MRKMLVGLVLCIAAGCGNPCEDQLTDSEVDLFVSALEVVQGQGLSKSDAILQSLLSCPFDLECRECWQWMVEIVY